MQTFFTSPYQNKGEKAKGKNKKGNRKAFCITHKHTQNEILSRLI